MRVLYQFPLSPYCEKARWLLDHKSLDYVAQNLIPGPHRVLTQLKTKQNLLPMLHDAQHWVADSTHIALYLDAQYPEHSLLRRDRQLRDLALELDQCAGQMGVHVRRWTLANALGAGNQPLEIMMGEKGYLRQFERLSRPLLKKMVQQNYQLQPAQVAASKIQLDQYIARFNTHLTSRFSHRSSGRLNDQPSTAEALYMVGDRFGLADIAVCAMLAPILQIEGTPWELEDEHALPPSLAEYKAQLLAMPLGQYVLRIYQNHRFARVDWRGV